MPCKSFSYKDMEKDDGALMVVAESYVRYKSPAFYEDIVVVKTNVAEVRSRSIRFVYEIVPREQYAAGRRRDRPPRNGCR